MMLWERTTPQPLEADYAGKPRIRPRTVLLTILIMAAVIGYLLFSIISLGQYHYVQSVNCSRPYFNEVSGSAYAASIQFFHPFANITPELIKECQILQQLNTSSFPNLSSTPTLVP